MTDNWSLRISSSLLLLVFTIGVCANTLSVPIRGRPWPGSHVLMQDSRNLAILGAQQCFDQRQPNDVQLKPIHYPDCIKAAEKITFGGKAGAPMHFSRDPRGGMELPESWAHGSCVIRVDMKQKEDQDTFPLFAVANAGSLIAQKCSDFTPTSPGLGGLGIVGPRKVVVIIVYGRTPPPAPRPRPTFLAAADAV
ncbi:MAG: hypothetical protein Q9169_006423 [Polycauliona sp. 2 TL-2023]